MGCVTLSVAVVTPLQCSFSIIHPVNGKEKIRAHLVMKFKNCYLKRCKNCSLKNIVEKRVFNGYKTKNVFGMCV